MDSKFFIPRFLFIFLLFISNNSSITTYLYLYVLSSDSYHRISFALALKSVFQMHHSVPEIIDRIKLAVLKTNPIDLRNPDPNKLKPEDMNLGIFHVVFLVDDSFMDSSLEQYEGNC